MTHISAIRSRVALAVLGAGVLAVSLAGAGALAAQETERFAVSGGDVAIYNLAGEVRIEGSTGPNVVVEMVRGGRDAGELTVDVGSAAGVQALRVIYPGDRIVYPRMGRGSSTTMSIRPDGTFGSRSLHGRVSEDDFRFTDVFRFLRGDGRVRISRSGSGTEAYADLRVLVPQGQRVAVFLGVGSAAVSGVDGDLIVDVSSAPVTAERTRGALLIDTGSGSVRVTDAEGDVTVDTGSGRVNVTGVRGGRLHVDTGSGSVSVADVQAGSVLIDTGSGRVEAAGIRADDVEIDTGSGSVRVELLSDVRSMRVDTGSGGVTLVVPPDLGAEIEVDTGSGGISADVPIQLIRQRRNYLLGRIGDGQGRIVVDTGSGGVRIRGR